MLCGPSSVFIPIPLSMVLVPMAKLAFVAVEAVVALEAVEVRDDMEAVEAREDEESDFLSFFLLPPTSLASMSRSMSSVTGFFKIIVFCRISGWFQIYNSNHRVNK